MNLPLQNFATLVKTQVVAVSSSCQELVDTTVGSVLRAILEANASVGLWIQWLILQVLATTRAATSNGVDLDSWVADFGMSRLPAAPAAGQVTFSRATAGLATVIPVGAQVRTGTDVTDQVFAVSADQTNPAWNGTSYQVNTTDLSVTVPAVASIAGIAGNVRAAAIGQLATAVPGIDTVTNNAPMMGGLDAESDVALRGRFAGFLDSRTRATEQAVGFAIQSVRQGLSYTVAERVDASGAVRPGHFTVTVDDGTGAPSTALTAQVAAAIDAVRPLGGTFTVRAPQIVSVAISMQILGSATALNAAKSAVMGYVSGLPIGMPLVISKMIQVAHDADPGVTSVSNVTINSQVADLAPPVYGLIRPNSVAIAT